MPKDTKNIFISHVHEDDAGLQKTKDLLGNHGMIVRDGSINSDKPNNANNPEGIMISDKHFEEYILLCISMLERMEREDSWPEFIKQEGRELLNNNNQHEQNK